MTSSRLLHLTAAVPSKELLTIVTLSWNGRHLYLVPTATTFFTLTQDDQASVRQLARDLWIYFEQRQIDGILVRRGPSAGPHQASAGSTRFETILQLLQLTCAHVHVQKVLGWARQQEWLLPLPQAGLRATEAKLQEQAILTAAFGIACVLDNLRLAQI